MIAEMPTGAIAVIFHSVRRGDAGRLGDEYAATAERMDRLAADQPGFLSVRSARDPITGEGITVSYWRDDASARSWKAVAEHLDAQRRGRDEWYAEYDVVVAEITRSYSSPDPG